MTRTPSKSALTLTRHQTPSPEIVVDSIVTIGASGPNQQGLGGSVAKTRYAYGNIEQFFDPMLEAFRSTGYLRRVELTEGAAPTARIGARIARAEVRATITDSYRFEPLATIADLQGLSPAQRMGRYLLAGRPSDVATVMVVGNDPWALLALDTKTDGRVRGNVHYFASLSTTRVESDASVEHRDECTEMAFPYDYAKSRMGANDQFNACTGHGFFFVSGTSSWRGFAAPPSPANVETGYYVTEVDNLGRTTKAFVQNDVWREDDNYCVEVKFAAPVGAERRVLNAPASRKLTRCGMKDGSTYVISEESFEYDKQFAGLIGDGVPTARTVYLHAVDNGTYLGTVREMDISLDAIGNPVKVERTREDGIVRTGTLTYDEFGLDVTERSVSGTGVPKLRRTFTLDPYSNEVLSTTDENNTTHSTVYDGFGRSVQTQVRGSTGMPDGVIAIRDYRGFDGVSSEGPRVFEKSFTDPVAPAQVSAHEGRVSETYLDELGRERYTRVDLGSDYGNGALILHARRYDPFGRVSFEADPYSSTQDGATAYGTTTFYNADNTVSTRIKGNGPQAFTTSTDPAVERFLQSYLYGFANHRQTVQVRNADHQSGTTQYGVYHESTMTALGRTIARATWQGTTRLELAEYGYDVAGHVAKTTRYNDPSTPSNEVSWTSRFDSLGRLVELREPAVSPQVLGYSNFGELKTVTWTGLPPSSKRAIRRTRDAVGRMTESHEEIDDVTVPETQSSYTYDVVDPTLFPTAERLTGRLATATSPSGRVGMSYDVFGNVDVRRYTDGSGTAYVEREQFHADGSLATLSFQLPDSPPNGERIEYAYDSAGRPRWTWYDDGVNTRELYNASTIDAWGRTRNAAYSGSVTLSAEYADTGRRLPSAFSLENSNGERRAIQYTSYDAMGRELSRTEDSVAQRSVSATYDPLGRVISTYGDENGAPYSNFSFWYDATGNILSLVDLNDEITARLSYAAPDFDRVCGITYGDTAPQGPCTVQYNDAGAITKMPLAGGSTRELSYFSSGLVRQIQEPGAGSANFKYDPFGQVAVVDIRYGGQPLRSDKNFGPHITVRTQAGPFGTSSSITRRIAVPGATVTRRGANGPWVYEFAEERGTRFTADSNGMFLQENSYSPYGVAQVNAIGVEPLQFTTNQWNGGEALDNLGVVVLGARVYDPRIGRFLSRDPLMIPRSATKSNPYAFAWNDPINLSDPSGFDVQCAENPQCAAQAGLDFAGPFPGDPTNPLDLYNTPPNTFTATGLVNTPGQRPPPPTILPPWAQVALPAGTGLDLRDLDQQPAPAPYVAPKCCSYGDFVDAWDAVPIGDKIMILLMLVQPELFGGEAAMLAADLTADIALTRGTTGLLEGAGDVAGDLTLAEARGTLGADKAIWTATTNRSGGTVWTSEGIVYQPELTSKINGGLYKGDVHVLSGSHGYADGTMRLAEDLFADDVAAFGTEPGVHIHNMADLLKTPEKMSEILNGEGTIIGGFCNSGVCLSKFWQP